MKISRDTKTENNSDVADIDKSITKADGLRQLGLVQMQQLQKVKSQALVKEKLRLMEKLGDDHPRVKGIASRLKFNQERHVILKKEIIKTQIPVPDIDEDTALVQGRVLDKQGQPLVGLTVALADEKGNWIKKLGASASDEKGYYMLKNKTRQMEGMADLVYLLITDKAQKVLYLDEAGLKLIPGKIQYREIMLNDLMAPTPPDCDDDDVVLDPDVWKVWGYVRNQNKEPLPSLVISLHDKDLIFDDQLGTVRTNVKGEFALYYRTEQFRDLIEARPDLYLTISDKDGKLLHTTKKAVRFNAKKVEFYDITLDTGGAMAPPQTDNPKDPTAILRQSKSTATKKTEKKDQKIKSVKKSVKKMNDKKNYKKGK